MPAETPATRKRRAAADHDFRAILSRIFLFRRPARLRESRKPGVSEFFNSSAGRVSLPAEFVQMHGWMSGDPGSPFPYPGSRILWGTTARGKRSPVAPPKRPKSSRVRTGGNTLPGFSERTIAQSATVSTLDMRPSEVTADTVTVHPVQRVTQQDEENGLCQMLQINIICGATVHASAHGCAGNRDGSGAWRARPPKAPRVTPVGGRCAETSYIMPVSGRT